MARLSKVINIAYSVIDKHIIMEKEAKIFDKKVIIALSIKCEPKAINDSIQQVKRQQTRHDKIDQLHKLTAK